MVPIETEYRRSRMAIRSHLGSFLATAAVFAAIASTGVHVLDIKEREEEERPVYYLAPPKDFVETRSVSPSNPLTVDTSSLNVDPVETVPELDLRPLDISIDSDVSSDVTLNFDLARDFQAAAPGLMEFETFTIYDQSNVDEPPRIRYATQPRVPFNLRGEAAEVVLFYYVNDKGRTERPSVLDSTSENPAFGEAAKKALSSWRFKPATKDGKPVPCWVQQTIQFAAGSASPFSL
ncbi:energy transducer TonB [Pelagicoccus sp. SDUM812005]|uniref:energy transducer TonB n=1 Tax=Pelagicoccus sp. SDUM812005 TaxID=3041257 RepID=UPI002810021C|nr:energy transducer TonB [Pelagicoccus sp. SDUM812005]MDQ8181236.1 energy transducer TonB [Pelagicoccus sp. SDUM812005]